SYSLQRVPHGYSYARLAEVVMFEDRLGQERAQLVDDAGSEQDRHARRVLDVFGHRPDAQLARLAGDLVDALLALGVLGEVLGEAAVQLEQVRLQVRQQLERIQADAELRQRQPAVELAHRIGEVARRLEVGERS